MMEVLRELSERGREILTRFYLQEQSQGADLRRNEPDGDAISSSEVTPRTPLGSSRRKN
jgi:hypothetical protein